MGNKRGRSERGYALVASMMVLLLITALGALAMITSSSEQAIVNNLGEDQMLFFLAEQGVERILNHLHYLEGGLFSNIRGAGYDPGQVSSVLAPQQVLSQRGSLYWSNTSGTKNVQQHPLMKIDAYLDPQDFAGWWDRGVSRPVAITARVTNTRIPTSKVFRVYARPRTMWDFAYFSLNHTPAARAVASSPVGENCTADSPNWYACHPVFMDGDSIGGDTFVSNTSYNTGSNFVLASPDRARVFMRGAPIFSGELRWRGPEPFDNTLNSSRNQTRGGRSLTDLPTIKSRVKANAKLVQPPTLQTVFDSDTGYRSANVYDIQLGSPGSWGNSTRAWRIVFRNDLDTNSNGVRATSRVASAYPTSVNAGVSPTLGSPGLEDRGVMMVYLVPFTNAGEASQEETNHRAAFYGDSMLRRDNIMTSGVAWPGLTAADVRWASGNNVDARVSGANKCFATRINLSGSSTFGPYLADDIQGTYQFLYVPGAGLSNPCGGSTFRGVIFVEGDVILSGILDGQVTIVATGNIYLDHELQYENDPQLVPITNYAAASEPDILGLIAGGNIVIPNSPPRIQTGPVVRHDYRDDWSDPHDPEREYPYESTGFRDQTTIQDDIGDETLHAVMMAYGQICSVVGQNIQCAVPAATEVRQFRVGVYAMPRTVNTAFPTRSGINDPATPAGLPFDIVNGGNDSGWLRIVGSVAHNISGRLAWDYYNNGNNQSATCTTGRGTNCNRIGFSRISYQWDPRLKYLFPPNPRRVSSNYVMPYGFATWDIISWEELGSNIDISAAVW
jgi:hypothetical protein